MIEHGKEGEDRKTEGGKEEMEQING